MKFYYANNQQAPRRKQKQFRKKEVLKRTIINNLREGSIIHSLSKNRTGCYFKKKRGTQNKKEHGEIKSVIEDMTNLIEGKIKLGNLP